MGSDGFRQGLQKKMYIQVPLGFIRINLHGFLLLNTRVSLGFQFAFAGSVSFCLGLGYFSMYVRVLRYDMV